MYKVINTMKPVRDIYRQQLIEQDIPEVKLKEIEVSANTKRKKLMLRAKLLNLTKKTGVLITGLQSKKIKTNTVTS